MLTLWLMRFDNRSCQPFPLKAYVRPRWQVDRLIAPYQVAMRHEEQ